MSSGCFIAGSSQRPRRLMGWILPLGVLTSIYRQVANREYVANRVRGWTARQGNIYKDIPSSAVPRYITFPYTHPGIINVTLGMRNPEQVGRNVELHDQHIPVDPWDDLCAQGLTRPDVPPEPRL